MTSNRRIPMLDPINEMYHAHFIEALDKCAGVPTVARKSPLERVKGLLESIIVNNTAAARFLVDVECTCRKGDEADLRAARSALSSSIDKAEAAIDLLGEARKV
jgi:hypothetical protein